ncbi:MAG: DNA mismatch repair protein MutL [Saprospiraceae bacterium]|jgi:DNA mismatch repair protein MutL
MLVIFISFPATCGRHKKLYKSMGQQGIINLLPDSLANQIAAGEVIQRPASIVKELMENALDAGSTEIRLILKDSGKSMIQVVDNGRGMSETDARLCFERHATSKIKQTDDLFNIRSFGFRGEALASIAAVAHVDLKTKRKEDELGTCVLIEGSKLKKQEAVPQSDGTSFTVRNLFFNVPARRKFLKSDPVELRHILEEFARIALPHPEVFFSVHHNDNELYHFPAGKLRQRLVNYFGKGANEKIVPVSEETDFIKIAGFVGKPEMIKKTRGDQYIFVNQRFIKSHYLAHAIKIAYENLIPDGHFPFYVILLDIDPAMIDINIHPTKQEIKFENERLIYNYLKVAVKHALGKYSIAPSLDFDAVNTNMMTATSGAPSTANFGNRGEIGDQAISTYGGAYTPQGPSKGEKSKWIEFYQELSEVSQQSSDGPNNAITLSSDWDNGKEDDIGDTSKSSTNCFQVHDSYIISPIKSGLMVIDQSRAHERILYERHLKAIQDKKITAQTSLFPETIQVEAKYAEILEGLKEELKYIGFHIDKFGQNTFVINSTPTDGLRETATTFVRRFVETYADNLELQISIPENIARSFAVNNRIKKGKRLEHSELQTLIDELFACENPYNNPSGKKCFITFGLDEVERQFNN